MREKWYGDKRDLVKWATLLHLARETGIKKVIQVTCLVPDNHGRSRDEHVVLADDFGHEVADAVWRHFRNLDGVAELGERLGVEVEVLSEEYSPNASDRDRYFESVARRLRSEGRAPAIVLLDPDTGLGKTRTHVTPSQVKTVKKAMRGGDYMVFYQHAPMYESGDWREQAQLKIAEALGVPVGSVTRRSSAVANDVVFIIWPIPEEGGLRPGGSEPGGRGSWRLERWLHRHDPRHPLP